jgi:hypothetical protein
MNRAFRLMALMLALGTGMAALAVVSRSGGTTPDQDRAELLQTVRFGSGAFVREYSRLADMLPNVKTADGGTTTDSVVIGTVIDVSDEAGYVEIRPTGGPVPGAPWARVTSFDDPAAHWRTLKVTVAVEEALAGAAGSPLELSWPILGNSQAGHDGAAVGRALKSLGRIVVLSKADPPGPGSLGIQRSLPDKALGILKVGADGSLSLPLAEGGEAGLGPADGEAYLADLDTLQELRTETGKPTRPFPYRS